jgi:hypothetical protein
MTQLTNKSFHHVRYDIPTFVVGAPGQQGAYPKAEIMLAPGLSYPMNIMFTTQDGVPLNITPFNIFMVFWSINQINLDESPQILNMDSPGEIVLKKTITVDDGYDGTLTVLLDGVDTTVIGNAQRNGGVKWGIFLKNDTGHIFGCEVGPNGARAGNVAIQPDSYIPLGVLESL